MSNDHESVFRRIIKSHMLRYPTMKCTDIYKLIYQAAMGSAHNITCVETVRKHFLEETSSMSNGPEEPVVDIIAHDGGIFRINIRPYVQAGFNPEKLFDAFVQTGKEYTGSAGKLEMYCRWLIRMKKDALFAGCLRAVEKYLAEMSELDYPAVHHSSEYQNTYSPSYRVVASMFIKDLDIIQ